MQDFQRAQQELQQAAQALQETISRKHMRGMMRSMHLCAAECFRKHVEAADATLDNCQKTCAGPIERAQATVSDEMKRIQARLQREVAGCEDDARMDSAVTAASSDMAHQSAMEAAFAPCAAAAARATTRRLHEVVVPSLEKQLQSLAKQADR